MRKKKKRGSISELWDNVEEALKSYNSKKITKKEFGEILELAYAAANKGGISDMIAQNLIIPYLNDPHQVKVSFVLDTGNNNDNDDSVVSADSDWSNVSINLLGVYNFRQNISFFVSSGLPNQDDFEVERAYYFYKELLKLPPPYFIFIAILSKIAMTREVFTAEKRGGKKLAPAKLKMDSYFPLLWALKQFESFYKRIQNRDMRSDFGIIWHEGEWIEKNKKQEKKK